MRYGIVIEKAKGNYAAYVPDLPGCVSTGETVEEVERNIREAIQLHVEGMKEDGLTVPQPSAVCEYVEAYEIGESGKGECLAPPPHTTPACGSAPGGS